MKWWMHKIHISPSVWWRQLINRECNSNLDITLSLGLYEIFFISQQSRIWSRCEYLLNEEYYDLLVVEPCLTRLTLLLIPVHPIPPSHAPCYFAPLSCHMFFPYPPPLLPTRRGLTVHDFGKHWGFRFQAGHFSGRGNVCEAARRRLKFADRQVSVCLLSPGPTCVSTFWCWSFLLMFSPLPDPNDLYLNFSSSLTSRIDFRACCSFVLYYLFYSLAIALVSVHISNHTKVSGCFIKI
jgi:hypothetical protein